MPDSVVENKVIVNILGEDYPITATQDPAYISRIADFVDSRMKELAQVSRAKAKDKVAILAALSIASELFERTDRLAEWEANTTTRLDQALTRLDEVLAGAAETED